MDPQGFAAPKLFRTTPTARPVARPAGGPPAPVSAGQRAASVEKQTIENYQNKPKLEDRAIGALESVRNAGQSLLTFGWVKIPFVPFPFPVPALIATVFAKFGVGSPRTFVRMAFKAPIKALQETSLNEWHQLPANVMKNVSGYAAKAKDHKGIYASRFEQPASDIADSLATRGEGWNKTVTEKLKPLRDGADTRLDAFSKTGAGETIERGMVGIAKWREAANKAAQAKALAKQNKAVSAATKAFTTEAVGFWGRVKNFILRRNPATTSLAGPLSHVVNHAASGNGVEGIQILGAILDKNGPQLPEAVVDQARAGVKHVQKAAMAKEAAQHFGKAAEGFGEAARTGNLRSVLKTVGSAIGKSKLFYGAMAVAVTAGIAAKVLSTRKEGRLSREALADLTTEMGSKDHWLVQAASTMDKGKTGSRWLNFGMSAAAEGAFLVPGLPAPAAIAIQTMPMTLGGLLQQNAILGSYQTLKHIEKHRMPVEVASKAELILPLVAAVPDVAKHGGRHNRLAVAISESLAGRDLSVKETLGLLGNREAFVAMASEIKAKQEAAKKPAEAAPAKPTEPVVSSTVPAVTKVGDTPELRTAANQTHAVPSAVPPVTKVAEKPALRISANDAQHAGAMQLPKIALG